MNENDSDLKDLTIVLDHDDDGRYRITSRTDPPISVSGGSVKELTTLIGARVREGLAAGTLRILPRPPDSGGKGGGLRSLLSADMKKIFQAARGFSAGNAITFADIRRGAEVVSRGEPIPKDKHTGSLPLSRDAKRFVQDLARRRESDEELKGMTAEEILRAVQAFEEGRGR